MSLFEQYLRKSNHADKTIIDDQGANFSEIPHSEFSFDCDKYLEKARQGQKLEEAVIKVVCEKVKEIFAAEKNVCVLKSPITLVGDIHGQFEDMMLMFQVGGEIPDTNYLFMGDYVDRGSKSVEVITLLMILKLRFPNRICLLRGNHETRQITQIYGFYTECQQKYGNPKVWQYFTDVFDYFPIGAIVDNKVFAVHGGLSPTLHHISDIDEINRIQEIPHEGPFADLMWSDPEADKPGFGISARGAGYIFGEDVCEKFLDENGMNVVYRAHQLCKDGYQILFGGKLATVWSAPDYCHRYENLASICELDEQLNEHFNIFESAPVEGGEASKKQKQRDVWSEGSGSTKASSRMNSINSSGSGQSQGRNGGGGGAAGGQKKPQSRDMDFFM